MSDLERETFERYTIPLILYQHRASRLDPPGITQNNRCPVISASIRYYDTVGASHPKASTMNARRASHEPGVSGTHLELSRKDSHQ
jgi:hypothetical protein